MAIRFTALTSLALLGAVVLSTSSALAAAAGGVPCSGVWKLNEQLTHRTRSPIGPIYQFFEPWGPDGWMRMNTQDLTTPQNGGEWHFEQFNDKPYQVFGGDPSLQHVRMITDRIFATQRVREKKEADLSFVVFSQDCKRVTYYFPEGEDRHGAAGKQHYYNDVRVFDRIEAPAGGTGAPDIFGGWMLDRAASKMTMAPMDAETVVLVPWGKSGWVWNRFTGGPYQTEDLMKKVSRVECGAAQGATARACEGPPPTMTLYWAAWDSKPYATYGSHPGHVQMKRLNDRSYEVTERANGQAAQTRTVNFSADGKHMTVTTTAGGKNDMRVYDRIEAANWPTVAE
jgi:hypothetical protein